MIIRASILLLLFTSAAATAAPTSSCKDEASPRKAYDRQMRLLEHIFETRSEDEAQLRSLYTRNAVLVESSGNEERGRDQIISGFRKVLASGAVAHFKVTTSTFRTDGNLSYASGVEEIDERDGSVLRHTRNRFLMVMKNNARKSWRIDYVLEARA